MDILNLPQIYQLELNSFNLLNFLKNNAILVDQVFWNYLNENFRFLVVIIKFNLVLDWKRFIINYFVILQKIKLFWIKYRFDPISLTQNYAFSINGVIYAIERIVKLKLMIRIVTFELWCYFAFQSCHDKRKFLWMGYFLSLAQYKTVVFRLILQFFWWYRSDSHFYIIPLFVLLSIYKSIYSLNLCFHKIRIHIISS